MKILSLPFSIASSMPPQDVYFVHYSELQRKLGELVDHLSSPLEIIEVEDHPMYIISKSKIPLSEQQINDLCEGKSIVYNGENIEIKNCLLQKDLTY